MLFIASCAISIVAQVVSGFASDELAVSIQENLCEKIVYLPRRLPEMHVSRLGHLRYVDSHFPSDYFNVIVGPSGTTGPLSNKEVKFVTEHYGRQNTPATWIQTPNNTGLENMLEENGWYRSHHVTGFALDLMNVDEVRYPYLRDERMAPNYFPRIDLFECLESHCFQVYAKMLSASIPGAGNHMAIKHIYGNLAEIDHEIRSQLYMGLVFGPHEQPIGTASLFIRNGVAGLYEISFLRHENSIANAKIVVELLLSLAKSYNARIAVLIRSAIEAAHWTSFGFRPLNEFVIWKHDAPLSFDEL
eukprot:Gregarina_sp_Poly_1__1646@NODE_141_length_12988_cov_478_019271_g126_i0_p6_GENE_NODE_141_length_12988_cov_478_019271_g126_i0NODE_141_length_12988_cov_478_019271_g126_i0_p6_ORF_typecomplete_len303_score29_05_NODE_141_length_12988_cov_478_019271_g126_i050425950